MPVEMDPDYIEIYKHKSFLTSSKRWGWRRKSYGNHEVLSTGESFISKGNAKRAAKRANPDIPVETFKYV